MKSPNKLLIILVLAWSLSPLVWQLYTSFCTSDSITGLITDNSNHWTFDNYRKVLFADPPFLQYLINSLIVGMSSTLITLIIATPAAYSLNRIKPVLANGFKALLLSAALFPYVLLFLALLEIARTLDIGNNLYALGIPYSALSMPLAVLLLSSAFRDIPPELEEAARLEGLNLWQRLRWVLIPLIAPATGSTAILVFLFSWNEYPIALTWISKSELMTLPVAMARIAGSSVHEVPYGAFAAATVLGSIPLLLIVLVFQKQIVSGLTQGAIKG
ncbi:carbohydrate ABC transporter permease [Prochlorococcus sp. MIT 1300]|uniref:carbohydrate ABC transporter permease n=1 Tax=Prochlorococcus sp. MIT 1300 TaxID=3096218 RepID=UPI002A761FC9|nr:carbohydrate ABC transporter permease [Prochlorococcus sp. MIT 1300]